MSIKDFKDTYEKNKKKIKEWEEELYEEKHKINELHEVLANLNHRVDTLSEKISERKDYIELFEKIQSTTSISLPRLEKRRAVEAVSEESEAVESNESEVAPVFILKGSGYKGRVFDASLTVEDSVYKVLAGSLISPVVGDYATNKALPLRKEHKEAVGDDYKLTTDLTFEDLKSAATYIMGYNVSGSKDLFKEKGSGLSYREYFSEEE